MKNSLTNQNITSVRLDRWLWAARFFKTRALSKQAIEGGKVQLAGQRSKPSKLLISGEELSIRRGHEMQTVIVVLLSEKRGPAKFAQKMYQETNESILLRKKASELREIQFLSEIPPTGKPDKRQRRQIHQFKQTRDN